MAGGNRRKQARRKHLNGKVESASVTVEIPGMKKEEEEEALDLLPAAGKEDSASATAEILGMKKEEEALDLIRAGKEEDSASATAETPLMNKDLIRAGKESLEAATAEVIRTKKKEVLDLLWARKRMQDEAKPTGTEEKNGTEKKRRKKVVKRMFPQAAIDLFMTKRPVRVGVPEDVLAEYPQRYRDLYLITRSIANKTLEYEQAVVDQYLQLGYAVDEREVTDDEME